MRVIGLGGLRGIASRFSEMDRHWALRDLSLVPASSDAKREA